ncbi:MAG TPA: HAD-IC family P-type ATPase [Gemmatimonadaceae bacterium]|nr:HAD-IC family P-type ATPase [Gemmatimonadaceae bacterium]
MSAAPPESGGAAVRDETVWYAIPAEEALNRLDSAREGLSDEEARARLERHGPNEIETERTTPWWAIALRQFQDPLIYILMVAAVVTLLLDHPIDAAVIAVVLVLNAVIGFIQEYRAREAMSALREMSAPKAEVVRQGRAREIESRELVPGDIVLVASGARVPADLRLVDARELEAEEAALTGESHPVRKTIDLVEGEHLVPGDQRNMLFGGTIITRGRGRALVVRTGDRTEVGKIASTMREMVAVETPLQRQVHTLGRRIGAVILGLSVVVVAIGLWRGMPIDEILVATVALAVATLPEGLPVVLTVTLAIGVRRMARRKAIIRSLPAVETLGSTTVIGSDKTGTLTRNEMMVRAIWAGGRRYEVSGSGYSLDGEISVDGAPASPETDDALRETLLAGALANEAEPTVPEQAPRGDPTEVALHVAAAKGGIDPAEARARHRERDLIPFESERRMMATLVDGDGGRRLYIKGAPEAVLERSDRQLGADGSEEPLDADAIRDAAHTLAGEGLRVLAMATRPMDAERIDDSDLESGLVLVGLQGMEDPVRPEAVEAVGAAHRAGIRVLMLTGDHVDTARAIGRQLGLGGDRQEAIEGQALQQLGDDELDSRLAEVDIFARVAPEHKLRIVNRLKAGGEIVAVTGDGVNDAPALRSAHIGVAMGKSGTDVAREASDMVLADDNFATITAAVEEGRVVFANVRKVTFFLLSTGVAMPITIITALVLGWPLPFVAAQILWINVATNGLQDVALAFEPGEPGQLDRPPRPAREGIVTLRLLERLGLVGLLLATGTLAMFWWTLERTGDLVIAQSAALTQMVVFQFFHVFNCRSLDRSIFGIPPFANRFLFLSLVLAWLAHLAVLHIGFLQTVFRTVPLSARQWGEIVLVGSLVIVGGEIDKWWNRRRHRGIG